jgi:cytochrome c-type biogenesis protein CcmH/NrfG
MDMLNTQTQASAVDRAAAEVSRFGKFINRCLYVLVFLVPLLFLPFTSEVREFNKQSLLFFAVVVMLGVWVIKILTTRSVSWVKTSLDYVVLAYGAVYLLASFLSIDKVSSFLGYYGRFTGSFVSVLSLVVLYYLVVNNVRNSKITDKLMTALMASGALVMVYSFLQLLGVYVIRFDFAKSRSFNPIGTMSALAVFSAIMVILVQWSWMTRQTVGRIRHIVYILMTLLGLAIMFLVNAFFAWVILALGLIVFLAMSMVLSGNKPMAATWFWRPLLVLVVAVLFVAFQFLPSAMNPRRSVTVQLPVEIQLANSANWNLVKNALSHKPILGYGPGTTGIAFGEIKPPSINKSIVWSLSFDRSSSQITNLTIETGLLGLLAFEATSILFLLYALFFLLKRADHPGRNTAFGLFLVWLALYIAHFFYYFNTTFEFLFWLSLAMFVAVTHWGQHAKENASSSLVDSPRSALSWMFASLLVLAVLLVGGFFQVSVYFGDVAYASGIRELNKENPDFSRANSEFSAAISRNQYRDTYYLAYGQNLLFQAAQEAAKDQPNVQQFQQWIAQLVAAGNSATNISPAKAANWSARAQFYSQLRTLAIPGTNEAIISSWEEAAKRDPNNPAVQVQLALAYTTASETIDPKIVGDGADSDGDGLADAKETELQSNPNNKDTNGNGVSDGDEVKAGFNPAGTGRLTAAQLSKFTQVDESMLKKAEESAKKAITLKDDLPDSYIALSRVYEKWNKLDEASAQLTTASQKFPGNADVKYELGRITFNQKKYADAEKIFNAVIKLVPNHANAHYSLGLVALQKGDKNTALAEFEKTREISGPNVDLEKAINDLKTQLGQQ